MTGYYALTWPRDKTISLGTSMSAHVTPCLDAELEKHWRVFGVRFTWNPPWDNPSVRGKRPQRKSQTEMFITRE